VFFFFPTKKTQNSSTCFQNTTQKTPKTPKKKIGCPPPPTKKKHPKKPPPFLPPLPEPLLGGKSLFFLGVLGGVCFGGEPPTGLPHFGLFLLCFGGHGWARVVFFLGCFFNPTQKPVSKLGYPTKNGFFFFPNWGQNFLWFPFFIFEIKIFYSFFFPLSLKVVRFCCLREVGFFFFFFPEVFFFFGVFVPLVFEVFFFFSFFFFFFLVWGG